MEELLNAQAQKMTAFGERNKKNGHAACNRAKQQEEIAFMLTMFYYWKLDASMSSSLRNNQQKVESKRQQLLQVQQMFRSFAGQLEAQLKGSTGVESARGMAYKRTHKSGGSCSLPDINSGRR